MPRLALLLTACALGLAGCDSGDTIARLLARQDKIDPPKLWLAEGLGPTHWVHRRTQVCADSAMREGFARAEPEVNGQVCRATSDQVQKPGLYAMRCEALGEAFGVTVTSRGDARRDFTVRYALTSLDTGRGPFVQTVRFRLVGPCPKGWRIGDQRGDL